MIGADRAAVCCKFCNSFVCYKNKKVKWHKSWSLGNNLSDRFSFSCWADNLTQGHFLYWLVLLLLLLPIILFYVYYFLTSFLLSCLSAALSDTFVIADLLFLVFRVIFPAFFLHNSFPHFSASLLNWDDGPKHSEPFYFVVKSSESIIKPIPKHQ